jgi:Mrp family chromosome partitioning ATPase
VADTPILAVKVDAALLISSFGKTKKSEMLAAKDALDKVGARIVGFVINSVEPFDVGRFGHYYQKTHAATKKAA